MSSRLCGLAVLTGLVLSVPLAQADEDKPRGKKLALLVGVRDYEHNSLSALEFTENDVEELASILQSPRAGFQVVVLTSTRGKKDRKLRPTAANIRAQLKAMLEKITRHDLVVIGLAGHGMQVTVTDPNTKKDRDESFFCPADAKPSRSKNLATLRRTMIPLMELFRELQESGAGVKLLFVDACRNDLKARSRNIDSDNLPRPSTGTAALFSCKGGERAFETKRLGKGHGVFFHHIIQGLKGKAENQRGEVIWSRLVEYVVENVADSVPSLIGGGARQTPQEIKNITGKSPVLLGASDHGEKDYQKALAHFYGIATSVDEKEAAQYFEKAVKKGHPVAPMGLAFLRVTGLGLPPDRMEADRLSRAAAGKVRALAQKGDADAANWLGTMLREGLGMKQDSEEAFKWFSFAASKGVLDAMDNLGNAYLSGEGVARDEQAAAKWYRQAAEKGLPGSMTHLGELYLLGVGIKKDEKEAVRWATKAADKGEPSAMVLLGDCYYSGKGIKQSDAEAQKWYTRAAKKGFSRAQVNLGWMWVSGRAGKKDFREALRLFQQAADRESTAAMTALAYMYENALGVERNDREAVKWYKKAADRGDAVGMEQLGAMYEGGYGGLDQDAKKAVRLYRKAADKGAGGAMARLGRCYARGVGVEKDDEEAVRWFRAAEKKGDPDGIHELGYMYETGRGVDTDEERAAALYRRGAAKGVLMSMNNLALLHLEGRGAKQSDDEAFKLLKQAAEKGLATAQNNLAYLYEEGKGTKVDLKLALQWYKKAAAQGHEEARKKVKEFEKKNDF